MTVRLALCFVVLTGCADGAPDVDVTRDDGALVYGADDRRDYYQLTAQRDLDLARSTAALVDSTSLTANAGGWSLYTGTSFGSAYSLCADEPFRTQPTTAWCSGFVIAPDLIATAGHCVTTQAECNTTSIVFGFRMDDASTVHKQLASDDVYRCTQIVGRQQTTTNDWAVLRVERVIVGHPPLPVRTSGKVADTAALVLSGHPAGIPLKVAAGATVRSNTPTDYFETNVDSYGGNSGSPVMNASTGVVEGILVRGNNDFVYNRTQKCYRSQVCNDSGCPGWEDATRTIKVAQWAAAGCTSNADCADGNPCNGDELCNNGACAPGSALDCSDANQCTTDACGNQGGQAVCNSTTVTCNDNNACTTDGCSPASGCTFTAIVCPAGQSCSGGVCSAPQCGAINTQCTSNSQCCSGSCNTKKHKCR